MWLQRQEVASYKLELELYLKMKYGKSYVAMERGKMQGLDKAWKEKV